MNARERFLVGALTVCVLVLSALACGASQGGTVVGTVTVASTPTAPTVHIYKLGEVIEVKGHTITLTDAQVSGGVLSATFSVENKGAEDLVLSSLLSFTAKDEEGAKLEQEIFECKPMLDGTVLPGDRSKGKVCWKAVGPGPFRIYYQAELFGSGAVVWEVE